jgi:hypothetical protein
MEVMKEDREELKNGYQNSHYALFRASYLADDPTGEQPLNRTELPDLPLDYRLTDDFATGYQLIALGKLKQAATVLADMQGQIASTTVKTVEEGLHEDRLATSPDGYLVSTIMARELEALLMYREGNSDAAIELLGEMLLAQGHPEQAISEFELSLLRNTNRSLSLLGLARAQEAAGNQKAAAETKALLASNWKGDLQAFRNSTSPWLGD